MSSDIYVNKIWYWRKQISDQQTISRRRKVH